MIETTNIERSLVRNRSEFDEFMQIFVSEQSKKCHWDGWFGILVASLGALIDIEPKQTPKLADHIQGRFLVLIKIYDCSWFDVINTRL